MAQVITQANALATSAQALARRMRGLKRDIDDFIVNNNKQAINWAVPPAYITAAEDASGNLGGFPFSPANMSNIIGTFAQFQNLMNNAAVTQGDHAANVYAVASDSSV